MSSVNEYWSRASEIDRLEIKTSSSSDESEEESSSSGREYRDASCYVEFDEELDRLVSEYNCNFKKSSRHFSKSQSDEEDKTKASNYVRWDVLMSLGLILWAILCLVDVFRSAQPANRGWFFEAVEERKNTSKSFPIRKPETSSSRWFFGPWSDFWKIVWISGSGGIYVLLIGLLVVFCADPRVRKTPEGAATEKLIEKPSEEVKVLENKNIKSKKPQCLLPEDVWKVLPMMLAPRTAIYLRTEIISKSSLNSVQSQKFIFRRQTASIPRRLQSDNRCSSTLKRTAPGQRRLEIFRLLTINRRDGYFYSETSGLMHLTDLRLRLEVDGRSTGSSSVATQSSRSPESQRRRRSPEASRTCTTSTRIISSSPVFQDFLSRLKHDSRVS